MERHTIYHKGKNDRFIDNSARKTDLNLAARASEMNYITLFRSLYSAEKR